MIAPGIVAGPNLLKLQPPGPTVTASDASYGKVTVLLHGNGANGSSVIVDQTGNAWTANGDAQHTSSSPKYGAGALLFDGAGDYLSATVASAIGTADFTVEGWLRLGALVDGEIFCIGVQSVVSQFELVFETRSGGALRGSIQNGAGGANVDITSASGLLTVGPYYHVAFTAEGSTARLRIDGVVVATGTITGTRAQGVTSCRVGHLTNDPSLSGAALRYFNGRIDDLRVTRGVCRYPGAGAITPPAAQLPSIAVPAYVSRFSMPSHNDAQGVASDGTSVWATSSTTIYKYDLTGALVTSRDVSGDNPTDKAQINGLFVRKGKLYVSAAKFTGGIGTSWIVEYDASTLAYLAHHQLEGDHFSEGIAWRDGFWWVCFHANMHVCRFDSEFMLRATYPLTFLVSGPSGGYGAGTGYDGIAWLGDYLLCNVHEIYVQEFLDVYAWTGTGFSEVIRLQRPTALATQGLVIDPVTPTRAWFAERATSGTDSVAKVSLL